MECFAGVAAGGFAAKAPEVLVWLFEPVLAEEVDVMLPLVEEVFHLSSQEAYQYNRENFLYDRTLRRRKEFQVLLLMSGSAGISITRNLLGLENNFGFPIFATQVSKCKLEVGARKGMAPLWSSFSELAGAEISSGTGWTVASWREGSHLSDSYLPVKPVRPIGLKTPNNDKKPSNSIS